MNDLYDRAAAVLGQDERGIRWPYGLAPPLRRTDPATYEQRAADTRARQEVMVTWAQRYGLRLSEAGCCPRWLLRDGSQGCRPRYGIGDPCTRYGTPHPDSGWLDHPVTWLKDTRPAVLTAAPYDVGDHDRRRLAHWERADPRLRSAIGTGWYGFGTTQIVLWRSDRIAELRAAELPVRAVGANRSNRP
ncbi:hypothetical protein [Bacillus cereus]|uniref:hypothetical protein n=1 Tax=Bacillus cereus TaxID=1396 RepID=UPI003D03721D